MKMLGENSARIETTLPTDFLDDRDLLIASQIASFCKKLLKLKALVRSSSDMEEESLIKYKAFIDSIQKVIDN